ncbi:MAG: threonine synthase [Gemmatales bacterium]
MSSSVAGCTSRVTGLRCRTCGKLYPVQANNFCTEDFGPLEVAYDYEVIAKQLTKATLADRAWNMWRYRELLPLDGEPTVGLHVGGTPLVRAKRLGAALGVKQLYVKNDAVNFPTLSFKDRVVSVALSKAKELGFTTVGCASTGNLANSVAANAAAAGLEAYILVPSDLEKSKLLNTVVYGANLVKVHGTYDQVNRLCTQIAFKYGWGLVNINLRPFYAEGSKTMGYEIAEQLGWQLPLHVVAPMAGGSLIGKISKAFGELTNLGWVAETPTKFYGAQASGCSPISTAVKQGWENHKPVKKPNTIAKSLAIGDPADGYFANKLMKSSGGWAEDVTDEEITEGMLLLSQTEGIFAETAGGVTVAVTKKLIEQGRLPVDEPIVICITGNGLKTQDAVEHVLEAVPSIEPSLGEFDKLVTGPVEASSQQAALAVS